DQRGSISLAEYAGASTRERQSDGEEGIDDRLRVEVDRTQAGKWNVDEVGQRPETVEEDHQQEDIAGTVGGPPDQNGAEHQHHVRRALHRDLLDVRAIRLAEYDLTREEQHRDAPQQAQGHLQTQHDAQEPKVAL